MNKQIDRNIIESFFDTYIKYPGSCAEVRIRDAFPDNTGHIVRNHKYPTVCAGYFDRADFLSSELSRLVELSAYITVNPVSIKDRPAHAYNKIKFLKKGEFTTDKDIIKIRYAIIDIDPFSSSSRTCNSSNQELFECINVRDNIVRDMDWFNHCVPGISGNGAFILLYLNEMENSQTTLNYLNDIFSYLDSKYSNEYCKIDTNTMNPSRQLSIPGTWKFRDVMSTPERPHRRVEIQRVAKNDESTSPI